MQFDLDSLVRCNVRTLVPYSSARAEFDGEAAVFLDANESAFGSPLDRDHSRYPDPLQADVKARLAGLYDVPPDQIFIGHGSDEPTDLLFRIFCRPGVDNVAVCPPTYGMYEVSAAINDVEVRKAVLTPGFDVDPGGIRDSTDENTKLVFLCSPNNPTGNVVDRNKVLETADSFSGIVVVDEAYIHFSDEPSLVGEIEQRPNLVVLQTFSKAWGLAGLRVGLAFGDARITGLLNRIKPPYNIGTSAQSEILSALENESRVRAMVSELKEQRELLAGRLREFQCVTAVHPSQANFLLVQVTDADAVRGHLQRKGIIVRDRSRVPLCEGCLRITVGTAAENSELVTALEGYEESVIHRS